MLCPPPLLVLLLLPDGRLPPKTAPPNPIKFGLDSALLSPSLPLNKLLLGELLENGLALNVGVEGEFDIFADWSGDIGLDVIGGGSGSGGIGNCVFVFLLFGESGEHSIGEMSSFGGEDIINNNGGCGSRGLTLPPQRRLSSSQQYQQQQQQQDEEDRVAGEKSLNNFNDMYVFSLIYPST